MTIKMIIILRMLKVMTLRYTKDKKLTGDGSNMIEFDENCLIYAHVLSFKLKNFGASYTTCVFYALIFLRLRNSKNST